MHADEGKGIELEAIRRRLGRAQKDAEEYGIPLAHYDGGLSVVEATALLAAVESAERERDNLNALAHRLMDEADGSHPHGVAELIGREVERRVKAEQEHDEAKAALIKAVAYAEESLASSKKTNAMIETLAVDMGRTRDLVAHVEQERDGLRAEVERIWQLLTDAMLNARQTSSAAKKAGNQPNTRLIFLGRYDAYRQMRIWIDPERHDREEAEREQEQQSRAGGRDC